MGRRVFAYVSVGPLLRGRGNKITSFYNCCCCRWIQIWYSLITVMGIIIITFFMADVGMYTYIIQCIYLWWHAGGSRSVVIRRQASEKIFSTKLQRKVRRTNALLELRPWTFFITDRFKSKFCPMMIYIDSTYIIYNICRV